jgi:hypothetical protein
LTTSTGREINVPTGAAPRAGAADTNSGGEYETRRTTKLVLLAVLALAVCALTASAGTATGASQSGTLIPKAGTGSPQTGSFTPSGEGDVFDEELAEDEGAEEAEGPDPMTGRSAFRREQDMAPV